jgi:hypothetical protein
VGTLNAEAKMRNAILEARKKGISVVAIGIPDGSSKIYSMCMPYEGLRKTVARFLNAYTLLAGDDI